MKITASNVSQLSEKARLSLLKKLLKKLDEVEQDDFFGTEGWRRFLLGED